LFRMSLHIWNYYAAQKILLVCTHGNFIYEQLRWILSFRSFLWAVKIENIAIIQLLSIQEQTTTKSIQSNLEISLSITYYLVVYILCIIFCLKIYVYAISITVLAGAFMPLFHPIFLYNSAFGNDLPDWVLR
jgi:hypothetical protein